MILSARKLYKCEEQKNANIKEIKVDIVKMKNEN